MPAPADAAGDEGTRWAEWVILHLDVRLLRRRGYVPSEGEGEVTAWLGIAWLAGTVFLSRVPLPWNTERTSRVEVHEGVRVEAAPPLERVGTTRLGGRVRYAVVRVPPSDADISA